MAYERRSRHGVGPEDLAWVCAVLWPGSRTAVRTGGPELRVARVLPSARRPWVLGPALAPTAVLRALAAGRRLQTRRQVVLRCAAAAALMNPRAAHLHLEPDGGGPAPPGVVDRLAEVLGRRVAPLVVLAERDPNRKPMLQLVDERGTTLGYAKVGWNEATRAMVRREAELLVRIGSRSPAGRGFAVPRVIHAGADEDLGVELLVTAPFPADARRWPVAQGSDVATVRAVALATATGPGLARRQLASLAWWDELRRRLTGPWAAGHPESGVLRSALEAALAGAVDGIEVLVGGWHGDLAPWNLARAGRTTWIWDWEHAAADRPLGVDLLHQRFAVDRHVRRRSTATAIAELRAAAPGLLAGLDVPAGAADALVVGYLVDRWLRAAEIAATGTGWDAAIHPDVPLALRDW